MISNNIDQQAIASKCNTENEKKSLMQHERGFFSYKGKPRYAKDALIAVKLLTQLAKFKTRMTYTEFGQEIDEIHRLTWSDWPATNAQAIGPRVLHLVKAYCIRYKLPALNDLVYQKHTGTPGSNATHTSSLDEIYDYNWSDFKPTLNDLIVSVKSEIDNTEQKNEARDKVKSLLVDKLTDHETSLLSNFTYKQLMS